MRSYDLTHVDELPAQGGGIEPERVAEILEAEGPGPIGARHVGDGPTDVAGPDDTLPRRSPVDGATPTVVDDGVQHGRHQPLVRLADAYAALGLRWEQDVDHRGFELCASASRCPSRNSVQKRPRATTRSVSACAVLTTIGRRRPKSDFHRRVNVWSIRMRILVHRYGSREPGTLA